MNSLMFTFWNINSKAAFALSAVFPVFILLEGLLNGVLTTHPLFTVFTAAAVFYVVNGLLKVLDDQL